MGKSVRRVVSVMLAAVLVFGAVPILAISAGTELVPTGYTPIYTAQDLHNVRNNLSGKYILMNHIDLGLWELWEPIGTEDAPFSGVLDGNGYTVKNMRINSALNNGSYYAGLFGVVENANLRALGLLYFDIEVYQNSTAYLSSSIGSLAGLANNTSVQNCYALLGVINASLRWAQVGGLVGAINASTVSGCYNNSTVDGKCYINSGGIVYVGGIVGRTTASSMDNCYNTGNVTAYGYGTLMASGLVGCASYHYEYETDLTLRNCYNMGKAQQYRSGGGSTPYPPSDGQGITGVSSSDSGVRITLDGCYYLNAYATSVSRGTPLTEIQMGQRSSYVGFDFFDVWSMPSEGSPILRDLPLEADLPTKSTAIYTPHDLSKMGDNLTGEFVLMNDIDLTGWGKWTPIGDYDTAFMGCLDGNGYEIKNLVVDVTDNYAGLFSYITSYWDDGVERVGEIKNLTMSNVSVKGGGAGGIVGGVNQVNITNCVVTGEVRGTTYAGGLVGTGFATITNCVSNAKVIANHRTSGSSYAYAGGIIGASGASIFNSKNTGEVSAIANGGSQYGVHTKAYAGGIAGIQGANLSVVKCSNFGKVYASISAGSSDSRGIAGGIVGEAGGYNSETTSINKCYNAGEITSSSSSLWDDVVAGGISGTAYSTTISECENIGKVQSTALAEAIVGGLLGEIAFDSTVVDSYNKGDVTATSDNTTNPRVGGLVASYYDDSLSTISNCYNSGKSQLKSGSFLYSGAGIADVAIDLSNCYWLNTSAEFGITPRVTSVGVVDNSIALTDTQMRQQSSFVGFDFNTVWKMPEGGGYPILQWQDDNGGGTTDPTGETYTITYNANGGTGAPAAQTKTQGQPLTLSNTIPTREGYTFCYWANQDHFGSSTLDPDYKTYRPGDSYTEDKSVTLYAVWEANEGGDTDIISKNIKLYSGIKKADVNYSVWWGYDYFENSADFNSEKYNHSLATTSMVLIPFFEKPIDNSAKMWYNSRG
jgi:hypothetical protein